MNTDNSTVPKKALTEEQKAKKNALAREKRQRDKEKLTQLREKEIDDEIPKSIEDDSDDYNDTPIEDVADEETPEEVRKREIAEKRRASLAIARSKIKSKSQLTKEKDEEIIKIKEENEKLKHETQKIKEAKPKIIKKYIVEEPTPRHRSKSVSREKREVPRAREPSVDYLAQQTYAEQLQARLRKDVYERVMMDTFM